jgi:hypothetical protein
VAKEKKIDTVTIRSETKQERVHEIVEPGKEFHGDKQHDAAREIKQNTVTMNQRLPPKKYLTDHCVELQGSQLHVLEQEGVMGAENG